MGCLEMNWLATQVLVRYAIGNYARLLQAGIVVVGAGKLSSWCEQIKRALHACHWLVNKSDRKV